MSYQLRDKPVLISIAKDLWAHAQLQVPAAGDPQSAPVQFISIPPQEVMAEFQGLNHVDQGRVDFFLTGAMNARMNYLGEMEIRISPTPTSGAPCCSFCAESVAAVEAQVGLQRKLFAVERWEWAAACFFLLMAGIWIGSILEHAAALEEAKITAPYDYRDSTAPSP